VLQACLNGTRTRAEHPAVPLSAQEIAREAAASVAAGADALHFHPRDGDGRETLEARFVDAAVLAVRVSGGEISLTTGAWIEPDVDARLRAIAGWRALPDVCSVNVAEEGAEEVCRALAARGIEVEAGLAAPEDAERVPAVAGLCRRVLVEGADLEQTRRIETALDEAGSALPRLLHGEEAATWAVIADARSRGLPYRVGLEDVLLLPEGSPAPGNAALVRASRR
jgi:uncharacterized protein (DUF849 family)